MFVLSTSLTLLSTFCAKCAKTPFSHLSLSENANKVCSSTCWTGPQTQDTTGLTYRMSFLLVGDAGVRGSAWGRVWTLAARLAIILIGFLLRREGTLAQVLPASVRQAAQAGRGVQEVWNEGFLRFPLNPPTPSGRPASVQTGSLWRRCLGFCSGGTLLVVFGVGDGKLGAQHGRVEAVGSLSRVGLPEVRVVSAGQAALLGAAEHHPVRRAGRQHA